MNTNHETLQNQVEELLAKQEPLLPELKANTYCDAFFGECVKHPLLFALPCPPEMNAFWNHQFTQKKELAQTFLNKKKWASYVFLHERPYMIYAFQEIEKHLSDSDYWKLFSEIFSDTENLNQWEEEFREIIDSGRPGREAMMDEKEQEYFRSLPDVLTIYRGCRVHNKSGYSWSLSKNTARWFAARSVGKFPIVRTGKCKKSDIIAFLGGRNEDEVVILPENVFSITEERGKSRDIKVDRKPLASFNTNDANTELQAA